MRCKRACEGQRTSGHSANAGDDAIRRSGDRRGSILRAAGGADSHIGGALTRGHNRQLSVARAMASRCPSCSGTAIVPSPTAREKETNTSAIVVPRVSQSCQRQLKGSWMSHSSTPPHGGSTPSDAKNGAASSSPHSTSPSVDWRSIRPTWLSSTERCSCSHALAPPRRQRGGSTSTALGVSKTTRSLRCRPASRRTVHSPATGVNAGAVRAPRPMLYGAIFARTGRYYPAVNSATLWLIAGESARARQLAEIVLDVLARSEERSYWAAATEAEARLLRGDSEGAAEALERAATLHERDYAALATTRRQLRTICEVNGIDDAAAQGAGRPGRRALLRPQDRGGRASSVPARGGGSGGGTHQRGRSARHAGLRVRIAGERRRHPLGRGAIGGRL